LARRWLQLGFPWHILRSATVLVGQQFVDSRLKGLCDEFGVGKPRWLLWLTSGSTSALRVANVCATEVMGTTGRDADIMLLSAEERVARAECDK
jgi:hypothetical protein